MVCPHTQDPGEKISTPCPGPGRFGGSSFTPVEHQGHEVQGVLPSCLRGLLEPPGGLNWVRLAASTIEEKRPEVELRDGDAPLRGPPEVLPCKLPVPGNPQPIVMAAPEDVARLRVILISCSFQKPQTVVRVARSPDADEKGLAGHSVLIRLGVLPDFDVHRIPSWGRSGPEPACSRAGLLHPESFEK